MTAYEVRISDWSSDVCSSDLKPHGIFKPKQGVSQEATARRRHHLRARCGKAVAPRLICVDDRGGEGVRSVARVGDASRRSRCRPQGGKEAGRKAEKKPAARRKRSRPQGGKESGRKEEKKPGARRKRKDRSDKEKK